MCWIQHKDPSGTDEASRKARRQGTRQSSRSTAWTGAFAPDIRWAIAPYTSCCWRTRGLPANAASAQRGNNEDHGRD